MKFRLEIELGDSGITTYQDLNRALEAVSVLVYFPKHDQLLPTAGDGANLTLVGKQIGLWEITEDKQAKGSRHSDYGNGDFYIPGG